MSLDWLRNALVIDDDEFVCTAVARMVESLGARVDTAADGNSARERLASTARFDLVVIDLKMPGLDGIELMREFGQQQPDAALILISSTDPMTLRAAEQLAQARHLRVLGSLAKPVSAKILKDLLINPPAGATRRHYARPVAPLVTVEELRTAIGAGEIDVHVQPKVDLGSGRLAGVEALARWPRPDGSLVMPGDFIALAERSGLADALTRLVLRRSLQAWGDWKMQGLDLAISVNVGIDSLDYLDLPDAIAREAAEHGVPNDRVVLEITETGLMRDLVRSLDVVTRLRLRGFRLSIDDFGIGYSSLEQLKRFPFSELKLDRSFVDGAARDQAQRSIVESSIRLARDLRLKTCAEGIENEADLDLMRELGCHLAQGFLIARPMPTSDLVTWSAARIGLTESRPR